MVSLLIQITSTDTITLPFFFAFETGSQVHSLASNLLYSQDWAPDPPACQVLR